MLLLHFNILRNSLCLPLVTERQSRLVGRLKSVSRVLKEGLHACLIRTIIDQLLFVPYGETRNKDPERIQYMRDLMGFCRETLLPNVAVYEQAKGGLPKHLQEVRCCMRPPPLPSPHSKVPAVWACSDRSCQRVHEPRISAHASGVKFGSALWHRVPSSMLADGRLCECLIWSCWCRSGGCA